MPEKLTDNSQNLELSENKFPVVGVGASAGGLTAFKEFVGSIPEKSGMAYVLVQHLDPTHESLLSEILQKSTPVPVLEITDDIEVKPDPYLYYPQQQDAAGKRWGIKAKQTPSSGKKQKEPSHRSFL